MNIGSIQAAKVLPGRTHYAPTKLGLEALTRNMSAEMTPLGIRVNCVHPGLIDTPMTEWVMKDPEILPIVLGQISLGRAGQPREIGASWRSLPQTRPAISPASRCSSMAGGRASRGQARQDRLRRLPRRPYRPFLPVHHRQPGHRRAEIGNALPFSEPM